MKSLVIITSTVVVKSLDINIITRKYCCGEVLYWSLSHVSTLLKCFINHYHKEVLLGWSVFHTPFSQASTIVISGFHSSSSQANTVVPVFTDSCGTLVDEVLLGVNNFPTVFASLSTWLSLPWQDTCYVRETLPCMPSCPLKPGTTIILKPHL